MDLYSGDWNPTIARAKQDLGEEELKSMVDDKMSKNIMNDLRKHLPPGGFPKSKPVVTSKLGKPVHFGPKKSGRGQDKDLVSSMATRLSKLELLCDSQRREIKEKSTKIQALQKKIKVLQRASSSNNVQEFKALELKNQKISKQLKQMEEFLADYGLVWVGKDGADKNKGEFDANSVMKQLDAPAPAYRNNLPSQIDLNVIMRRIEQLNFIAQKSYNQKVVKKNGYHQIEKADPVTIAFFRNGLAMRAAGGFHPYHSKQAQSILSDILDGYFPYDLKKEFPDGAILKVVDRTQDMFKQDDPNQNIKLFADLQVKEAMAPSKQEFLSQFPKNIIKKGMVIPIREELEKKFDPKKSMTKFHMNPVITPEELEKKVSGLSPEQIVTLRIRTQSGNNSLILKFNIDDTISSVYDVLDGYSECGGKGKYDLRSKFPMKIYERFDPSSLKQLGLAPQSALVMQKI